MYTYIKKIWVIRLQIEQDFINKPLVKYIAFTSNFVTLLNDFTEIWIHSTHVIPLHRIHNK